MTDNTYNGWANWETWIINLYFGDDTEYIEEMAKDADYDVADFADRILEYVESYIDDMGDKPTGIVAEFFNGCMREVNWYDLAESWMPEIPEEEEEEEEEEDSSEWESESAYHKATYPIPENTGTQEEESE